MGEWGILEPQPDPETLDEGETAQQGDRDRRLLEDRPPHYDR